MPTEYAAHYPEKYPAMVDNASYLAHARAPLPSQMP